MDNYPVEKGGPGSGPRSHAADREFPTGRFHAVGRYIADIAHQVSGRVIVGSSHLIKPSVVEAAQKIGGNKPSTLPAEKRENELSNKAASLAMQIKSGKLTSEQAAAAHHQIAAEHRALSRRFGQLSFRSSVPDSLRDQHHEGQKLHETAARVHEIAAKAHDAVGTGFGSKEIARAKSLDAADASDWATLRRVGNFPH
jgi:hypothetical protein